MESCHLKGKRILITNPFIYEINGATNVALELANYLKEQQATVTVFTNVFEDPVKKTALKQKIQIDTPNTRPEYHLKDFDYIWVNSQTIPITLLNELTEKNNLKHLPKIIFMHMSAHDYCPDEMPYIYKFEENFSALSLFVSEEAFEINKKYYDKLPSNINFYRNPSPSKFTKITPSTNKTPKKILVVDNFPCEELKNIRQILKKQNIKVDFLGRNGDKYKIVDEIILSQYDLIITIGKTVQYCLVSGKPVYIYGPFGGPGWLTNQNFDEAKKKNFSGRGFSKKTSEMIVDELLSQYQNAKKYYKNNLSSFKKEYLIDNVIPVLFSQANNSKINPSPLTKAQAAAHSSLLYLMEICWNYRYGCHEKDLLSRQYNNILNENQKLNAINNSLIEDNNNLLCNNQELTDVINSRSVRTWLKLNKKIHNLRSKKIVAKPEIIAVLCAYNEQLNIDGCIKHLTPYVDKIVILDDGSTDDTIKLAKKHKIVTKIIKNTNKTKWDEKKNREIVLREAYNVSNKKNPWALCIDADERFEIGFLKNMRKIIKSYSNPQLAINVHFKELWDNQNQYRTDGVWSEKKKDVLLPLSDKMTFNYPQEHHFPWHYEELNNKEVLLDYNLYHLKMIKQTDRKTRAKLYNELDPKKKLQSIGYDYLTDTKGIKLERIPQEKDYDHSTVPEYYNTN